MSIAMAVDWNGFLTVGVPLWIAAIGSAVAAVVTSMNRRSIRTPSGDSIGEQVESAHHLTAANTALLTQIHNETGSTTPEPEEEHDE